MIDRVQVGKVIDGVEKSMVVVKAKAVHRFMKPVINVATTGVASMIVAAMYVWLYKLFEETGMLIAGISVWKFVSVLYAVVAVYWVARLAIKLEQ